MPEEAVAPEEKLKRDILVLGCAGAVLGVGLMKLGLDVAGIISQSMRKRPRTFYDSSSWVESGQSPPAGGQQWTYHPPPS